MGIFNSDIIGGDAALEIAMDLLAAAGIFSSVEPNSNSTENMWGAGVCRVTMPGSGPELTCRHTVKQYAGMYAALEQACGRAAAVEANLDRMKDIATSWAGQALAEAKGLAWSEGDLIEPARGGPKVHGNALQILALIVMQSGCPLPSSLRTAILASLDQDRAARELGAHSRRVVMKLFRRLVEAHDGGCCIWYRPESFLELMELSEKTQRNEIYFRTEDEAVARLVAEFEYRVRRGPAGTALSAWAPAAARPSTPACHDIQAGQQGRSSIRESDALSKTTQQLAKLFVCESFNPQACCPCGQWQIGADSQLRLQRCARCESVWYCSAACQKEHWPMHKADCRAGKPKPAKPARAPELKPSALARIQGLQSRADLNGAEVTLLEFASDAGRWAVKVCGRSESIRVKPDNLTPVLMDKSDQEGFTRLQLACQYGDLRQVRLLLAAGASPDIARAGEPQYGCSALYLASSYDHLDCTELLLASKASPNLADDDGNTPLHVACERKRRNHVQLLLDAGGDAGVKSQNGKMPLHKACKSGSLGCVELLLSALDGRPAVQQAAMIDPSHRLLINEESVDGHTALTTASYHGHKSVVKVLLQAKASALHRCQSARHWARENGHVDVIALLEEAAAAQESSSDH